VDRHGVSRRRVQRPRRHDVPRLRRRQDRACKVGWRSPAQCAYRELWDSINGKRAPWSSNPWVVAITFEVIKANIDAVEQKRGRLVIERIGKRDFVTPRYIEEMCEKTPAPAKRPRLWLRPARRDAAGRIVRQAVWIILDRGRHIATGCAAGDAEAADRALAAYLAAKHDPRQGPRRFDEIAIPDVLSVY
jgi:hypothetical protein